MADPNDPDAPRRSDEPATTPRGTEGHPRQSEVNASRADREEAASRASARESGRGAAKWFGIALAALVVILVLGGLFGGGSWMWGPTDEEPIEETEEG